jgi:hypothetical protein
MPKSTTWPYSSVESTGEAGAEAVCALHDQQVVSVANEDSVSLQYDGVATCELVRVSDALAIVDGRGELPPAPFIMVFVDADKTRLIEFAKASPSNDRVLRP